MRRMCTEYQIVVRMLEARGLPEFALLVQERYGSVGDPTLADLGEMITDALRTIGESELAGPDETPTTPSVR